MKLKGKKRIEEMERRLVQLQARLIHAEREVDFASRESTAYQTFDKLPQERRHKLVSLAIRRLQKEGLLG